jgi:hypothetical protein
VGPLSLSLSPSKGERVPFRAGEGPPTGSPSFHGSGGLRLREDRGNQPLPARGVLGIEHFDMGFPLRIQRLAANARVEAPWLSFCCRAGSDTSALRCRAWALIEALAGTAFWV